MGRAEAVKVSSSYALTGTCDHPKGTSSEFFFLYITSLKLSRLLYEKKTTIPKPAWYSFKQMTLFRYRNYSFWSRSFFVCDIKDNFRASMLSIWLLVWRQNLDILVNWALNVFLAFAMNIIKFVHCCVSLNLARRRVCKKSGCDCTSVLLFKLSF